MTTDRRVALVTGGSSGIGAAIVQRLLADGFAVLIAVEPPAPIPAGSGDDEFVASTVADLLDPGACDQVVADCVGRFGRLDVLVNNAAVTGPAALASVEDCTDEQLDRIIGVNLCAPFRCARAAVPHLRAAGDGVIVNIGSVAAFAAQRDAVAYGASKAGLLGLTRGLAFELAADGIRAVMIAPGDIAVERQRFDPPIGPAAEPTWTRRTPLGRRGLPADVAAAVSYACSADASFVTGTCITVDGGWLAY